MQTQNRFSQRVASKALVERPWVRKVGANTYRVTPRTADHGKYELTVEREGGELTATSCVDVRTGEECQGFKFNKGNCYHACRLLIHLIPKEARAAA